MTLNVYLKCTHFPSVPVLTPPRIYQRRVRKPIRLPQSAMYSRLRSYSAENLYRACLPQHKRYKDWRCLSAYWRFSGTYSGTSITSITASTTIDLDAIDRTAPTVTAAISNITADGFKISVTSSATADRFYYSLDDGGSSTLFSSTAGTSASTTITGLDPNTTYAVRGMVRKRATRSLVRRVLSM